MQFTFNFYCSIMIIYHETHIAEADSVAFHILRIVGIHPRKGLEDQFLVFLFDADTVVGDADFKHITHIPGSDEEFQVAVPVFDGIVDQVGKSIEEMCLDAPNHIPFRVQFEGDRRMAFVQGKLMHIDDIAQEFVHGDVVFFLDWHQILPVNGEHFFHQIPQRNGFRGDHFQV